LRAYLCEIFVIHKYICFVCEPLLCCLVLELQRAQGEETRSCEKINKERDASKCAFGSFYSGMREREREREREGSSGSRWVGETDWNVPDKPDPVSSATLARPFFWASISLARWPEFHYP
jgi:hypothetical protein